MKKTATILVLPSWYPSAVDKFSGDFIQRHVHSIALYQKQYVLYAVKKINAVNRVEVSITEQQNIVEKIIYFRPRVTGIGFIDRIISHSSYTRHMKNAVKEFIASNGLPILVHVHVGMKAGIIARWVKQIWGLHYIVSEHWTGYFKEEPENVYQGNSYLKTTLGGVLRDATAITAVSRYLSNAIQAFQPTAHPVVIPNVVNTAIFYPLPAKKDPPVFIHASMMNYQKNTETIIAAMPEVNAVYPEARLHLYGPMPSNIRDLIQNLGDTVSYKGEVSQQELAVAMHAAAGLVLYSRYETFGCVIIEALACKLPVIVSNLPVFHELLTDGKNAIFVDPGDSKKLALAMTRLLQSNFDDVNFNIDKYRYETVGKKFVALYNTLPVSQ